MKKITIIGAILALGLIAFSGCNSATKDIKVTSQTSEMVNLKGYKTFAWLAVANVLVDKHEQYKSRDFSVNDFINTNIEKELLLAKKVKTSQNPDFLVSFIIGADMDAVKEKVNDEGKEYLKNVPKAALVVLLMDTKTQKLIWAGTAEAEINKENSDEEAKVRLTYAVQKMFSNFE